jgi:hypothetical protein
VLETPAGASTRLEFLLLEALPGRRFRGGAFQALSSRSIKAYTNMRERIGAGAYQIICDPRTQNSADAMSEAYEICVLKDVPT